MACRFKSYGTVFIVLVAIMRYTTDICDKYIFLDVFDFSLGDFWFISVEFYQNQMFT